MKMALSVLEFKNFDFIPDGFHSFEETVTYCKKFTKEVRNILEKVQDAQDLFQTLVMILEYFTLAVDKLVICRDSHELVRFLFLECCKPLVSLKLRECEEKLQFSFKVTLIKVHDAVVTTLGFPYFWQLYGIAKVPWDDMVCKMMAEQDLDTKEVFTYIGSQDMNLMRLRADVMQKNDCEAYCMNLCTWLLKHPFYRNDTDLRARQLMLLHKLGEKDKFHVETWKVDCCMGLDIVKNHPMIREERKIFVSLVQTFLVQDWVRPKHKCCTKELLKLWLPLQWRDDVVKVVFEEGVMKLVELAVDTTQVMYLVEMLQEVFGKQFHSLCFKICSIRLQAEKLALEEAKDQKKIEKSEQATSSLSYVCQVVSALQDGCWMKKVSLLTSLSLAPTEETFHLLRKVSWLCDQECDQREGYEEHNEGCTELDSNNEDHVVSSPDVQISHGKQTQSSGGGSQLNMTLALNKGNPVLTNMGHGDPDTTATGQTLGTCSWSHLRNSPEDCLNILGNWERSKHGLDITKQSGAHHEDQDMDSSNKHAPEMDEENQGRQHSQIEAGVQDGVERMNKFQDKLLGNRGRIPGPLFQEVIDLLSSIRDQSLDPSLSWPDLQTSVLTYMQKAGLYYDSQSGEFLCNIQPVVRVERLKERSQSHEPNTASSEGDGDEEDADDDYRTRWPRVINGFVTPYVSDVVRQDSDLQQNSTEDGSSGDIEEEGCLTELECLVSKDVGVLETQADILEQPGKEQPVLIQEEAACLTNELMNIATEINSAGDVLQSEVLDGQSQEHFEKIKDVATNLSVETECTNWCSSKDLTVQLRHAATKYYQEEESVIETCGLATHQVVQIVSDIIQELESVKLCDDLRDIMISDGPRFSDEPCLNKTSVKTKGSLKEYSPIVPDVGLAEESEKDFCELGSLAVLSKGQKKEYGPQLCETHSSCNRVEGSRCAEENGDTGSLVNSLSIREKCLKKANAAGLMHSKKNGCPICCAIFKYPGSVKRHITFIHFEDVVFSKTTEEKKGPYMCLVCNDFQTLTKQDMIMQHICTHAEVTKALAELSGDIAHQSEVDSDTKDYVAVDKLSIEKAVMECCEDVGTITHLRHPTNTKKTKASRASKKTRHKKRVANIANALKKKLSDSEFKQKKSDSKFETLSGSGPLKRQNSKQEPSNLKSTIISDKGNETGEFWEWEWELDGDTNGGEYDSDNLEDSDYVPSSSNSDSDSDGLPEGMPKPADTSSNSAKRPFSCTLCRFSSNLKVVLKKHVIFKHGLSKTGSSTSNRDIKGVFHISYDKNKFLNEVDANRSEQKMSFGVNKIEEGCSSSNSVQEKCSESWMLAGNGDDKTRSNQAKVSLKKSSCRAPKELKTSEPKLISNGNIVKVSEQREEPSPLEVDSNDCHQQVVQGDVKCVTIHGRKVEKFPLSEYLASAPQAMILADDGNCIKKADHLVPEAQRKLLFPSNSASAPTTLNSKFGPSAVDHIYQPPLDVDRVHASSKFEAYRMTTPSMKKVKCLGQEMKTQISKLKNGICYPVFKRSNIKLEKLKAKVGDSRSRKVVTLKRKIIKKRTSLAQITSFLKERQACCLQQAQQDSDVVFSNNVDKNKDVEVANGSERRVPSVLHPLLKELIMPNPSTSVSLSDDNDDVQVEKCDESTFFPLPGEPGSEDVAMSTSSVVAAGMDRYRPAPTNSETPTVIERSFHSSSHAKEKNGRLRMQTEPCSSSLPCGSPEVQEDSGSNGHHISFNHASAQITTQFVRQQSNSESEREVLNQDEIISIDTILESLNTVRDWDVYGQNSCCPADEAPLQCHAQHIVTASAFSQVTQCPPAQVSFSPIVTLPMKDNAQRSDAPIELSQLTQSIPRRTSSSSTNALLLNDLTQHNDPVSAVSQLTQCIPRQSYSSSTNALLMNDGTRHNDSQSALSQLTQCIPRQSCSNPTDALLMKSNTLHNSYPTELSCHTQYGTREPYSSTNELPVLTDADEELASYLLNSHMANQRPRISPCYSGRFERCGDVLSDQFGSQTSYTEPSQHFPQQMEEKVPERKHMDCELNPLFAEAVSLSAAPLNNGSGQPATLVTDELETKVQKDLPQCVDDFPAEHFRRTPHQDTSEEEPKYFLEDERIVENFVKSPEMPLEEKVENEQYLLQERHESKNFVPDSQGKEGISDAIDAVPESPVPNNKGIELFGDSSALSLKSSLTCDGKNIQSDANIVSIGGSIICKDDKRTSKDCNGATIVDKGIPLDDICAPIGDSSIPSGDICVPRGDNNVPSGDSSFPSGDSSIPSGDICSYIGDSNIPTGDSSIPSGDICSYIGDSNIPSGDSSIPSGDSSIPSVDICSFIGDSSIPNGDSSKPSGDICAPFADSSIPSGVDISSSIGDNNIICGDSSLPSGDICAPSGDSSIPSGDICAPSGDSSIPSVDTCAPSGDSSISGANICAPSGDSSMPSGDICAPSGDSSIPSGDIGAPIGDSSIPSGDSSIPSGDSSIPSGNICAPIGDSTIPSGDSSMPSGDIFATIGDSSIPSGDSSIPSGDIGAPIGDSSIPSGDSSIPSGDIDAPIGDSSIPSGDVSIPSGDICAPIGDGNIPSGVSIIPSGDTCAPIGDSSIPSGDSSIPSGDICAPISENNIPSGDSSIPSVDICSFIGDNNIQSGDSSIPSGDSSKPSGDNNIPIGDGSIPSGDICAPSGDSNLPYGVSSPNGNNSKLRSDIYEPIGHSHIPSGDTSASSDDNSILVSNDDIYDPSGDSDISRSESNAHSDDFSVLNESVPNADITIHSHDTSVLTVENNMASETSNKSIASGGDRAPVLDNGMLKGDNFVPSGDRRLSYGDNNVPIYSDVESNVPSIGDDNPVPKFDSGDSSMAAVSGGDSNIPSIGDDNLISKFDSGVSSMAAVSGGDSNIPSIVDDNPVSKFDSGDSNIAALSGGDISIPSIGDDNPISKFDSGDSNMVAVNDGDSNIPRIGDDNPIPKYASGDNNMAADSGADSNVPSIGDNNPIPTYDSGVLIGASNMADSDNDVASSDRSISKSDNILHSGDSSMPSSNDTLLIVDMGDTKMSTVSGGDISIPEGDILPSGDVIVSSSTLTHGDSSGDISVSTIGGGDSCTPESDNHFPFSESIKEASIRTKDLCDIPPLEHRNDDMDSEGTFRLDKEKNNRPAIHEALNTSTEVSKHGVSASGGKEHKDSRVGLHHTIKLEFTKKLRSRSVIFKSTEKEIKRPNRCSSVNTQKVNSKKQWEEKSEKDEQIVWKVDQKIQNRLKKIKHTVKNGKGEPAQSESRPTGQNIESLEDNKRHVPQIKDQLNQTDVKETKRLPKIMSNQNPPNVHKKLNQETTDGADDKSGCEGFGMKHFTRARRRQTRTSEQGLMKGACPSEAYTGFSRKDNSKYNTTIQVTRSRQRCSNAGNLDLGKPRREESRHFKFKDSTYHGDQIDLLAVSARNQSREPQLYQVHDCEPSSHSVKTEQKETVHADKRTLRSREITPIPAQKEFSTDIKSELLPEKNDQKAKKDGLPGDGSFDLTSLSFVPPGECKNPSTSKRKLRSKVKGTDFRRDNNETAVNFEYKRQLRSREGSAGLGSSGCDSDFESIQNLKRCKKPTSTAVRRSRSPNKKVCHCQKEIPSPCQLAFDYPDSNQTTKRCKETVSTAAVDQYLLHKELNSQNLEKAKPQNSTCAVIGTIKNKRKSEKSSALKAKKHKPWTTAENPYCLRWREAAQQARCDDFSVITSPKRPNCKNSFTTADSKDKLALQKNTQRQRKELTRGASFDSVLTSKRSKKEMAAKIKPRRYKNSSHPRAKTNTMVKRGPRVKIDLGK